MRRMKRVRVVARTRTVRLLVFIIFLERVKREGRREI